MRVVKYLPPGASLPAQLSRGGSCEYGPGTGSGQQGRHSTGQDPGQAWASGTVPAARSGGRGALRRRIYAYLDESRLLELLLEVAHSMKDGWILRHEVEIGLGVVPGLEVLRRDDGRLGDTGGGGVG